MAIRKVSVGKQLASGSTTIMYTVPTGYRASWNLLFLTNHTTTSKTFTVEWRDVNNNLIVNVFLSYPLTGKEFLKMDGGSWVQLEEGHTITIIAETGADADAICSFELERNNG